MGIGMVLKRYLFSCKHVLFIRDIFISKVLQEYMLPGSLEITVFFIYLKRGIHQPLATATADLILSGQRRSHDKILIGDWQQMAHSLTAKNCLWELKASIAVSGIVIPGFWNCYQGYLNLQINFWRSALEHLFVISSLCCRPCSLMEVVPINKETIDIFFKPSTAPLFFHEPSNLTSLSQLNLR